MARYPAKDNSFSTFWRWNAQHRISTQHPLIVYRGYILENHTNSKIVMCKVKISWEKWGQWK
jgi:hypothetical protein